MPPPAPTFLTITNAGNLGQNVQLAWNPSPDADSYNIYRCLTNIFIGVCQWENIAATAATNFTDIQVVIRSSSQSGDTFHYHVTAVNSNGESSPSNSVETFGEKELFKQTAVPKQFTLHQNFPNPFNPSTEIKYDLPEASEVTLTIYNLIGQQVRTLVNETQNAGVYRATWNGKDEQGRDVASGIYIYRIKAAPNQSGVHPFRVEKKMTLLR